jgi:hypothetical protein
MMSLTAKQLAAQLQAAGIKVTSTAEADYETDAMVEITGAVHVTIPTFGGHPTVVRMTAEGSFMFYAESADHDALLAQIRVAIEEADHEALQQFEVRDDLGMGR